VSDPSHQYFVAADFAVVVVVAAVDFEHLNLYYY